MSYTVKIYSKCESEISNFLNSFFNTKFNLENPNLWQKDFESPIEMLDIMCTFADNKEKIKANMLISLDKDIYISISEDNINQIVKYIYERFPY